MAAAAEQLAGSYQSNDVDDTIYRPVDASPYLAAVRSAARQEAWQIIESRRELLRQADYEAVPLPVDVLGSAQAVVMAGNRYGEYSEIAQEKLRGLQLDCQRLLAEAARKNTYEYFPPLKQQFDPISEQYYSHGFSIRAMTEAGLTPVAEPEELERRVNEHTEEETYRAIGQMAVLSASLAPNVTPIRPTPKRIRTISECPDWASEALERQSKGGYGGYVPEIAKFMVRDVIFDPATGDRYEEQVGVPGNIIDHEVITRTLEARGVSNAAELTKTQLQALQFEAGDSVLDFIAQLDSAASTKTGQPIFMGEAVESSGDYRQIPTAAANRQASMTAQAAELAAELVGLQLLGTDRWAAAGIVEARVKNILFSMATTDTSLAAAMFDANTARGLQQVSQLFALGETELAQAQLKQVETQAPAPSYCGAGSCGLERVDSVTSGKMEGMGLDSSKSLKDTERRCPKCSKKEIVYDLKNKLKGCLGCKTKTSFSRQ